MNGLERLASLSADRSSSTYWTWLEWVSILVPVSIFLGYYSLMVGFGHGVLRSVLEVLLLVGLIVLFSRIMFGAIGRLRYNVQDLSLKVSTQNDKLRLLHEANLALSQERVSAAAMQRVADLGRHLFQAKTATLTVVGPRLETLERYCSPAGAGSCVHTGVVRMVQQGTEPLRLSLEGRGPIETVVDGNPGGSSDCLGMPMIYQQTLLGSLCFCRDADDEGYTVQDEELARLFASQAAVAIHNAQLTEQTEDLAVLQERDRIAREMHDGMAQVLGYINTQTIGIKKLLDDEKLAVAREELSKMEAIARDLYGDVREGILGLRVAAQGDKGLIPILREYIDHYRDMSGLDAEARISSEVEDLAIPTTDEVQLLRIVQEALTNVRKHAGANKVSVSMEHVDNQLCIQVQDDGNGFDPKELPASGGPRFGLRVMEERALSLGGQFNIYSGPSGGTNVAVRVPVSAINTGRVTA